MDKIKAGLEATGHYSYNILGFPLDNGLATYVINPLHTNLYRKSLSLRKTKTDRVDARTAARHSVGSAIASKSLELRNTIGLIHGLDDEIAEIEEEIQAILTRMHSPITTIPGMGFRMAAMILAEIGDFSSFSSPDKILAYAGFSPSTYQSGHLTNGYAHMEKRGSRYLRYAIFNATKYVCHWEPAFAAFLAKKQAEGKHYNVAVSHAAKKLVRLIYATEKSRQSFQSAANPSLTFNS